MQSLLRDEERQQAHNDGDKIRIEQAVSDKMNSSVAYNEEASHASLPAAQHVMLQQFVAISWSWGC